MKILFGTDLHKRTRDLTTIIGYCAANKRVQLDLMDFIKDNEVDYFVHAGDWYDGGYGSDVGAALSHTDLDYEMNKLLKGNFYGVIGNHIRIKMDSNPELFLIQPHDYFKSRWECDRAEQIIKTPPYFIVNGVQISLCHFNHTAESAAAYSPIRQPGVKYHVAVFHTERVIPNRLLKETNPYLQSTNDDILRALEGVDYAIVGHVHKPLGMCTINHADGAKTILFVPGSLSNTEVSEVSMHTETTLPLLEIGDNGEVSWSYHDFDLHTDMCEFAKKGSKNEDEVKLGALRFNSKESLYEDMVGQTVVEDDRVYMSLNRYLERNNYTAVDKNLIKSIIHNPEDIDTLITTFKTTREVVEV